MVREHPYPERDDKTIRITDDIEQLCKPEEYIKNNFLNWNFGDRLPKVEETGKLTYRFEFNLPDSSFSFLSDLSETVYYLAIDGRIKKGSKSSGDYFEVYDRDTALAVWKALSEKLMQLCNGYATSLLEPSYYFTIKIRRIGAPTHLFTKKEIEDVMRNADDRRNNQLVIDEDGFAHVVDRKYGDLYPVSHETWCGYKNYVGRYSSLPTLDENYLDSLDAWLSYLREGTHVFCHEWQTMEAPETLISKIVKYYNV